MKANQLSDPCEMVLQTDGQEQLIDKAADEIMERFRDAFEELAK